MSPNPAVVTEVWASAGSGKTTLLSLWAHAAQAGGESVAWVGLTPGVGSRPALPTLVDDAVRRGAPNRMAADTTATSALRLAAEPLTLIFDDLHHLRSRIDSEWLLGLIRDKHPSVRIVLAGRFAPSTLARRGLLPDSVEYRSGDLAFTRGEARDFFAARNTLLEEVDLDAAYQRTGGWAAALALLAGWMRGAPAPQRLPRNFNGDHRAIADYLVSEVLEKLAPAQREFLLTTSVVDAITLPFAVFLTGRDDAGDILDQLEYRTSLVSHRPDDEGVYSYHPTLLSYLRAELRRRDFSGFARSVSAATEWYRRNGRPDLALELCLRSDHSADLLDVIDEAGAALVFDGHAELVVRALAALERAGLHSTTAHVLSALVSAPYFPDEVRVDHHLAAAGPTIGAAPAAIRLIHATLAVLRSPVTELSALRRALGQVEADVSSTEDAEGAAGGLAYDAVLLSSLAHATLFEADDEREGALNVLHDAVESSRFSAHAWLHLILLDAASTAAARQGRWPESASLHEEMASLASADGQPTNLVEAHVKLAVSASGFERLDSDQIEAQLDDLIAALPLDLAPGVVIPARALRFLHQLDAHAHPRTTIDDLDRLLRAHAHAHPSTLALCSFRYVAAMLHLHDRHQAKLAVDLVSEELGEASLEAALAVAQYNSSAGRQSRVEGVLEEALGSSRTIWNGSTPVYGWILLADWAELSGRSSRADTLLVKALEIADLMQARRPFVAEEQRGVRLLEPRIGRLGSHDDFARSIVNAAILLAPPSQPRSPDAAYFTPKEREILRELPRHQSVGEIAAKQQLSPNTIKTHMRSIYQKLGVSGRADAVEQAEANGLL
jgi:LuxR family maltose regulon positive regulatory protein